MDGTFIRVQNNLRNIIKYKVFVGNLLSFSVFIRFKADGILKLMAFTFY